MKNARRAFNLDEKLKKGDEENSPLRYGENIGT